MSEKKENNPGHESRINALEVSMSSVKTDIEWIKILVAPTFLISLVTLLILIATTVR